MKTNYFKKGLVVGTIFLFIGIIIIPSISGYTGNTSIRSTNKDITNFPLNDDYVNAYWKFDECSGNIAHDSSGHGYNGTIYGATWGGYEGYCALDFDGVDDYVDLDAHAQNYLGFNRTDDLIFSFYFKSTSTDLGIIYSISNTPDYGYKPGTHIALHPNGTLEFNIWFEGICGITLYTVNTYNDGEWHYVEVWYNGIIYPLNQTLKIFVDDEFDNSIEGEMCKFYADQFHVAKIGRKSYEPIDYFDGVLDEFKIIKYPGGNLPPSINISGPTHGEVGVEYNYTFLTIDPEGDDIWICFDWGDGTTEEWSGPYESGEEVTIRKVWDENGTYEIKAKARDVWGEGPWSSLIVIIGNQVPNPPEIDGPPNGKIGTEYSYTFVAMDPDENDVKYFIDWDDDNTEWTDYNASGEEVKVKHTWTKEGIYIIKAKVKDIYGAESDWGTFEVTMQKNKALTNMPFLQFVHNFLQNHPNLFQILHKIIQRLGDSGPKNYSKIHQHYNQGDVLTITDLINDVVLNYGKIVPRPNIDISSISCIKTGGEVEITLTLIETGKIQDTENIVYYIYLITSKNEYDIAFSNGECIVCDTNGDELEGVQYSGIGTTTLSISFNLVNSDEDLLEIMGMAMEIEGTDSYYSDVCPNPERKAFIFGKYSNLYTEDDHITIEAVNIQMIMFKPFQCLNYIAGEQIIFSQEYLGIITKQFIIGFFNVFGVYQRKTIRDYSTKYNLKIGGHQ